MFPRMLVAELRADLSTSCTHTHDIVMISCKVKVDSSSVQELEVMLEVNAHWRN
jgi:hypothetical protein